MPRNRGGFYGSYERYDRDFGTGGNLGRYDTGYRGEPGGGYRNPRGGGWSGYQDEGFRENYNGFGGRERMTFEPRHEYDRDLGDQLREGWRDFKRGMRRAFGGGGYDTRWRGEDRWRNEGGAGRWGNEPGWRGGIERGLGGGYETGGYRNRGYQSGRGWGGGWSGEGAGRGWGGGQNSGYGQGNRGNLGDRFETRGYGGDYQW